MNTAVKEVQVIKATKTGEKTEKIRVAAYCRVSTDKDDQLNSFFAQMMYYRDYVRGNDKMVLVDIYADEGITGTELAKRDEMKRLIRDCKHKKIDRVLVKSVTRFARNSLECIETIRTMKSCGVSVLFENDHIDTETMNSEMMLYIKSAFAQSEATSASKRMSTSIRMKMEDGTYYNTSRPYGYKWEDRNLVIVPKEAEIVREIFSMYLSGESFNSIIATIQPRTPERKWSPYSIGYVLTNEKYVGDILWQKSFTPSVLPLRKRYNRGEMPKYLCNDAHQAIISREDFSIVKRLMSERKEKFYSQNKREHGLYYGKIKCRSCGWTYRQHKTKKCTEWVCGKTRKGMCVCPTHRYPEDVLNATFVRLYNIVKTNRRILIDETISQLQTLKLNVNKGNSAISEIDEKIAVLSKQNSLYGQMFACNVIDEVSYREKTDVLKRQIAEEKERRAQIINGDENEYCLDELRSLKRAIDDGSDKMTEFNPMLFDLLKVIYAEENGSLSFVLKGELIFTVKTEDIYG